jgi:hypothetical protein
MKSNRSWLGVTLSGLYLIATGHVVWDAFRHTSGGWINLRGLGVTLVTAPSQVSFGLLFEVLGSATSELCAAGAAWLLPGLLSRRDEYGLRLHGGV